MAEVTSKQKQEGGDFIDDDIQAGEDMCNMHSMQNTSSSFKAKSAQIKIAEKTLKHSKEVANTLASAASSILERLPRFSSVVTLEDDQCAVDRTEWYPFVTSYHPDEPLFITFGDPICVNPNSYDSLRMVLRKLGQDAGVKRYGGTSRSWVILCCDGLPYSLCMKLISNTFVCTSCNASLYGLANIKAHASICSSSDARFYREFEWVLFRTGDGHDELNMFRSFVELNWEVFYSDLARTHNFASLLAQASAKRCDDTHKAWQILLLFHIATLKELVLPYMRECMSNGL